MLSIVVPFYNEEKNIILLYLELEKVFAKLKLEYETIFVDDGSTDSSPREAHVLSKKDKRCKLIQLRKRSGKGLALLEGVKHTRGETIIFMDADLQDDPSDIPQFLKKLKEGFDFVNGVRVFRKDSTLIRAYSKLANLFLKTALRSPFSDVNCSFKAMKKEVLDEVILYSNNYRFLPLAVYYRGFKVTEIPVHNRSRKYGVSKFGAGKVFIGILDTATAYFLYQFSERPLHFFGLLGGVLFTVGFVISLYLAIERLFFGALLYRRPVLFLGMLLIMVGIQIITTGILGELIVYLNKKNKS